MTDDHKPAAHPAANNPARQTGVKAAAKPPMAKKSKPKAKAEPKPKLPTVYQGTVTAPSGIKAIPAAAIATTLAAGALIGHALSRMLLRR